MKEMMAEARKTGFNHLIKEMNKIGVSSDEKRTAKAKPENTAPKKEKVSEKKAQISLRFF